MTYTQWYIQRVWERSFAGLTDLPIPWRMWE